jgi:hypothetical protein
VPARDIYMHEIEKKRRKTTKKVHVSPCTRALPRFAKTWYTFTTRGFFIELKKYFFYR